MNILKRELRTGIKPFIFWMIGLFFIMFAGLTKYSGFAATTGDADIMKIMNQFPRIVLAIFGMVDLDVKSLGGFYAILAFYVMVCIAIYAISLGAGAVNRESVDKTYEFLFTKPLSRKYILGIKLFSGSLYLIAFCFFSYIFAILSVATLNIVGNINYEMLLFSVSALLVGILFYSIGAFFAAISKRTEKGSLYGNLTILIAFIVGIIFDMFKDAAFLQIFTPFKYFLPADLLNREFSLVYTAVCIVGSVILLWQTFVIFNKKDLTAV